MVKINTLQIATCALLASTAVLCAQAPATQEPRISAPELAPGTLPPAEEASKPERWAPGFSSLTPEERTKLKTVHEKALQDPKIQAAREKFLKSEQEFQNTMRSAMVAEDPSVEPVLEKLKEAREKAIDQYKSKR